MSTQAQSLALQAVQTLNSLRSLENFSMLTAKHISSLPEFKSLLEQCRELNSIMGKPFNAYSTFHILNYFQAIVSLPFVEDKKLGKIIKYHSLAYYYKGVGNYIDYEGYLNLLEDLISEEECIAFSFATFVAFLSDAIDTNEESYNTLGKLKYVLYELSIRQINSAFPC